jgi:predicted DNA-binding protein
MSGGRKPLGDPKHGLAPLLNFRVPHEQADRLNQLVRQSGKTRSDLIRAAIDRYLVDELQEAHQAS